MRTPLALRATKSSQTIRREFHQGEESCGFVIGDVARLLWPTKTAAHIAALAHCTERNAEFCLAGKQKWSGDAIAAIVAEILKRHSMRNVKVVKRE